MAKAKKKAPKKGGKISGPARTPSTQPIQPLGDRVLVKRLDTEDMKSPAGIIIPDTAQKEKSKRGLVIATGPGRISDEGKLIPVSVKAGMKIYFNAGWDNEVKFDGDEAEYFLVHENDILATIK